MSKIIYCGLCPDNELNECYKCGIENICHMYGETLKNTPDDETIRLDVCRKEYPKGLKHHRREVEIWGDNES